MGRPERPVDPGAGPVARFAYELRVLRRGAGNPAYRHMAGQAHYSVTTLSVAASGQHMPSLPVTLAYVRACGGDIEEWTCRWHAADAELECQQARRAALPASQAPDEAALRSRGPLWLGVTAAIAVLALVEAIVIIMLARLPISSCGGSGRTSRGAARSPR